MNIVESCTFRRLELADVPELVSLHKSSFEFGVTQAFGDDYLFSLYSELVASSRIALAAVLPVSQSLIGFIIGDVDVRPPASRKTSTVDHLLSCFLVFRYFRYLRKLILFLFRKFPSVSSIICFSILTFFHRIRSYFVLPRNFSTSTLSHFAVNSCYRSLGVGRALLSHYIFHCRSYGVNCIVTRTHNKRLFDYYCSNYSIHRVVVTSFSGFSIHTILFS
ncbi:acyl-CoA N-acyltransferase [Synechococcus sp. PROS-7-1]|nr:acyl-CoA N-acyltransferase [Synechococcus sp. PROS-7-1]